MRTITGQVEPTAARVIVSGASTQARSRARWLIPATLLLVYFLQCLWFIGTQSITIDEPIDIKAGQEQWRTTRFSGGEGWNDHPPLAREWCTLFVTDQRFQILENQSRPAERRYPTGDRKRILPTPEALAWRTRPMNAVLGVILGVLLWLAARRVYSEGAANLAVALYAFCPSLIAHFSIGGANDGAAALMSFAAAFQLIRWRYHPERLQTLGLGLVLGGLLISKFSTLPLFAVTLGLVLILKPDHICIRPGEWNWRHAAAVLVIAFLVVWGTYRFHVSWVSLTSHDTRVSISIPKRPQPIAVEIHRPLQLSIPVPAYEFIQAIWFQTKHNREGHPGFLLGRSYWGGSKLYFPVAIALKWPTVVLLFLVVTTLLVVVRRMRLPREFALWATYPVVFFLLTFFARINNGERLVLPLYPFALLFIAGVWEIAKTKRVLAVLVVAFVCLHALDSFRYAPDYISYFNAFVRPTNSYMLLSDSNVDWGEGLIALRKYQQAHPNDAIHLAYSGTIDPASYGVHAVPLMPNEHASGTVIISANYLSGQTLEDANSYRWVLQYPRKAILNHTLHVFEVLRSSGYRGKAPDHLLVPEESSGDPIRKHGLGIALGAATRGS